ncbi:hypothetical protein ACDF64_02280 [Agromyces sp. MMS24-JH15]|uniref:hypothetical protein n=1 Tax=Agromyces sp. MMS24-JH15 TaxID=3243765 RepID=UPI003748F6D8
MTLRLERDALRVRGDRRAVVPRSDFRRVGEHDGIVELEAASGARYRFRLGRDARDWVAALATPPTPLGEQLGVTADLPVAVRGRLPVGDLVEALADSPRVPPWEAELVVAVVADLDTLAGLPVWLGEAGVRAPVWVIHGKGRACEAPGDAEARRVMRGAGWRDDRVSGVADCWSATRFTPVRA